MADKELDEAKKLTPEERIRKLREIAKKDQEEIEKAKELIKQSEAELEDESRKKKFPIPESREIDVSKLFEREQELEQRVAEEKTTKAAQRESHIQYETQELRYAPRRELMHNWEDLRNDIYQTLQEEGVLTEQQMSKLDTIMYATQSKMRDGSYVRESREIHEAAKRLKDRYRG